MSWRALLLGVAFCLGAGAPASARFLHTDPIRYDDGMNLHAYVGNDPINGWDPTGTESWLIARPVIVGDRRIADHMFVVVAPGLGEAPQARFSYGPSQNYDPLDGFRAMGSLVSLTNTDTPTNFDDASAWEQLANGEEAANRQGVRFIRIEASDNAVIAAGRVTDAALGNLSKPGRIPYHPNFPVPGGPGYANSNSAARSVADQAIGSSQPLPADVFTPGAGRSEIVSREVERVCHTGSHICR